MSDKLAMAIAQSLIAVNILANCKHICKLMTQARQTGARFTHFPEGALSGCVKSQIPSWNVVDWSEIKPARYMGCHRMQLPADQTQSAA